ncbi:hypothetical protein [Sulfurimonas sp.]|nr:hypothetical protein [Sulfurimonas sp.]
MYKGKKEVVERLSQIPIDNLYISRINYIEPFLDRIQDLELEPKL